MITSNRDLSNGVSIIRKYFQSNTNADIDAATIANLAVSDMKDLPPGTLPPVVLKVGCIKPSRVCLVTMNGEGMSDGNSKKTSPRISFVTNWQACTEPRFHSRSAPGGRYSSTWDPYKLEARQISPMDVVRSLSQANVVLPAGDVQIGNLDYNIYSNAQFNLKDAGSISHQNERPESGAGCRMWAN